MVYTDYDRYWSAKRERDEDDRAFAAWFDAKSEEYEAKTKAENAKLLAKLRRESDARLKRAAAKQVEKSETRAGSTTWPTRPGRRLTSAKKTVAAAAPSAPSTASVVSTSLGSYSIKSVRDLSLDGDNVVTEEAFSELERAVGELAERVKKLEDREEGAEQVVSALERISGQLAEMDTHAAQAASETARRLDEQRLATEDVRRATEDLRREVQDQSRRTEGDFSAIVKRLDENIIPNM